MTKPLATEIFEDRNPRLELDAAEIFVSAGPDKGQTRELTAEPVRIGSAPDADLVLHDRAVSSRHAVIHLRGDGYTIEDVGSKNGIFIGPTLVERARLTGGMRLRIGGTTLLVRARGGRLQIPLAKRGQYGELIVRSVAMRAAMATLEQLAKSDATILIEGETGAGKEVAAETVHRQSARRGGPFVVFDCAAATPTLMAASLFGHERGAFTGADVSRPGLFEEAEGGTIFIDEVGELPRELQPLLLGVLERHVSRRVGGKVDRTHDVRVVAATNRNLNAEIKAQRFREDLFSASPSAGCACRRFGNGARTSQSSRIILPSSLALCWHRRWLRCSPILIGPAMCANCAIRFCAFRHSPT